MCHHPLNHLRRLSPLVLGLLLLHADQASAQASPGSKKASAPDRTASWLMPTVEAPNLHYHTFASQAAGEKVSCLVYLPPGYKQEDDRRYPVVYWLHGIGGSQQGVPTLTGRVTQAIEEKRTPPFIMVFANGMIDSFYCDAATGDRPVETVIIKELIPHIDATLNTIARRDSRMIEGFSMGGFGAAHLGFKYTELFGSVSIIDGALLNLATMKTRHARHFQSIFNGQDAAFTREHPGTLLDSHAARIKGRTLIRLAVGRLAAPNEELHKQLTRLGIAHEYEVFPDAGHNHGVIYESLEDKNWDWYRQAFSPGSAARPLEQGVKTSAALPGSVPAGFRLEGERWTLREGDSETSGILLKPEGKGPFPAVLISHGLGGSASGFGMMKAREMVKWGLVCIAPDYAHDAAAAEASRSSSAPAKDYGASEENIRRAKACLQILRQMPEVDATRLGAYGHSMGGFVTIGLAAAEPALLKAAAITGSGIAAREGFPAPAAQVAEKIRTPFLMLHGSNDTTVRPEQSESLKQVLDGQKVPNDRLVADGQGHSIDQTLREDVYRLVREWFGKHGVLKDR